MTDRPVPGCVEAEHEVVGRAAEKVPRRWRIERVTASPAELQASSEQALREETVEPVIRFLEATSPALILGSTTDRSGRLQLAAQRSGLTCVRRASGGAGVLVGPGEILWVDVVVPRGDVLWEPEVNRSSSWLGLCWAAALEKVTGEPCEAWTGSTTPSPYSHLLCFAGIAPGEVRKGGRKVVGISQRRSRSGTLLQSAALLRWQPLELARLIGCDETELHATSQELGNLADGVGAEAATLLEAELTERLQHLRTTATAACEPTP